MKLSQTFYLPVFQIAGLFLFLSSCKNMYPKPMIDIGTDHAEVHFTRGTSNDQLDFIHNELEKKEIIIEYSNVKWDGGILSQLEFTIKNKFGNVGTAKTNFANLRGRPFGFYIQYDGSVFKVGDLDRK
ncbi:MAG: hypothetical protein ABI851_07305 [Saprospiraceae bacterium]